MKPIEKLHQFDVTMPQGPELLLGEARGFLFRKQTARRGVKYKIYGKRGHWHVHLWKQVGEIELLVCASQTKVRPRSPPFWAYKCFLHQTDTGSGVRKDQLGLVTLPKRTWPELGVLDLTKLVSFLGGGPRAIEALIKRERGFLAKALAEHDQVKALVDRTEALLKKEKGEVKDESE